jgi:hypothetical protein
MGKKYVLDRTLNLLVPAQKIAAARFQCAVSQSQFLTASATFCEMLLLM